MDGDSAAVERLVAGEDEASRQEGEEGQDVAQVSQQEDVGPAGHLTTDHLIIRSSYRKWKSSWSRHVV